MSNGNERISVCLFLFLNLLFKIFIHGFLHLLGYNHINYKDYKKMLKEEKKIFNSVKKFVN